MHQSFWLLRMKSKKELSHVWRRYRYFADLRLVWSLTQIPWSTSTYRKHRPIPKNCCRNMPYPTHSWPQVRLQKTCYTHGTNNQTVLSFDVDENIGPPFNCLYFLLRHWILYVVCNKQKRIRLLSKSILLSQVFTGPV